MRVNDDAANRGAARKMRMKVDSASHGETRKMRIDEKNAHSRKREKCDGELERCGLDGSELDGGELYGSEIFCRAASRSGLTLRRAMR